MFYLKILFILLFVVGTSAQTMNQKLNLSDKEKSLQFEEAAWNFFYFAEFEKAEEMLAQAVELTPKNESLKYGYAKVLVRNRNYKKAIEVLTLVKVSKKGEEEKDLLLAISFYNTDKTEVASELFKRVAAGNAKSESSVIAKNYLERIKEKSKKYRVEGQLGLMFDSRVIDQDLLSTTNGSDGRLFFGAEFDRRMQKIKDMDWNLKAEVANYFSFKDDHSLADPLLIAVRSPLSFNRSIMDRRYNLTVSPALEMIWLDIDNTGSRSQFLTTLLVQAMAIEEVEGDRVNGFHADVRLDIGQAESLEGTVNDIDGLNFRGGWIHTRFFNEAQDRLLQSDVFAKINLASGDDIKFYRVGGSYSYILPWKGFQAGLVGEGKVSLYPKATTPDGKSRKDLFFSAGAVASKSVKDILQSLKWAEMKKDWLVLELRAGLSANFSTLDVRDYERIVVSSMFKGQWAF